MKGLSRVSKATQNITGGLSDWIKLYYSFKTDTVYTNDGEDRFYVTDLIRPQEGKDIEKAVERWKMM